MKSAPAYYNEIDPYAAEWLRRLIAAGHLVAGDVDERSIIDVAADDLRGYGQCHFFAGIGGWPYALQLAGWDGPCWTGSCPCQPLSSAGQRRGHADERHLWPAFYDLIAQCRPSVVFGENVTGALGREWLAAVRVDLEAAGYAVGAADLPACSVSAPHIRQRLYWVADATGERVRGQSRDDRGAAREIPGEVREQRVWANGGAGSTTGGVADAGSINFAAGTVEGRAALVAAEPGSPEHRGAGIVGDAGSSTEQRDGREFLTAEGPQSERCDYGSRRASDVGFWADLEWLACADGKARPTQPGIFPLASGLSTAMDGLGPISRVGVLKGVGNAIVPPLAAEFVRAAMECRP